MKITIVQGPYFPVPPVLHSGVEKMWYGLGREFARLGHSVVHLSRQFPGLEDRSRDGGVDYRRLRSRDAPRSRLWYRAYDLFYSLRALRALPAGADILVSNCMWLPIFVRSRRFGVLCVHVARYPKGQMRLYRHAPRLQAVSRPVAMAIGDELGSASRIRIIPPFVEIEAGGGGPPPEARSNTILYVGRLHPEKGVHLLLEAFAQLRRPDLQVAVIGSHESSRGGGGDGYRRFLGELAARCPGQVAFLGPVDASALRLNYRSAAMLVYPSLAEGGESFGVVPLEAMVYGCPVLVSALQCFQDYLIPGQNGLVFDHRGAGAIAALTEALRQMAVDEPLRRRLGLAGYATAREFSLENIAQKYLADFEILTGTVSEKIADGA